MTRFIFAFAAFLFLCTSALFARQEISYTDTWGAPGMSLENQSPMGVEINFSIEKFFLQSMQLEGDQVQTVQLPGVFLPNNTGAPDLPGMGRFIAFPQGADVTYEITASRVESYQNIKIAPAPRIPLETEDGPLEYHKDMTIYSQNAYYPASPVMMSDPTQIRGVDVVILGITPFQYNPVTEELLVYRDLKVKVSFNGGNGHFGEDRLRSRWFDPILMDQIMNHEMLPEVDYNRHPLSENQDFEYVIITPDNPDYLAWADSIKQFRTQQGIRTGVVTLADIGGNTTNQIESWVDNAYNTWTIPPVAVLLLADYGTGPVTGNGITSPVYNSYCISDHIYADVNNNNMADVIFARITAQNAAQLQVMISKFLDYERQPPLVQGYYDNPITAMGWQTERWFQICSETVNGFFEYALGKQPVRENAIYSGSPSGSWSSNQNTNLVVDYFGPNGTGYIPATPNHLNDWGGNAIRINNDINNGAFLLQHRDHGSTGGWGEPDYQSNDINGLYNSGIPTFVFSINCLTGKFNMGGECFAEKFHRHPTGGALGIIAATETSYSFVNDTYVWGMYDNMWPQFMPTFGTTPPSRDILPAFGNAAGKYFLQQSNWPYNTSNKEVTYYLFHHHGDAFSTIYSEMPQPLTVTHNAVLFGGQTTFTVTADSGAFIALTVNGDIIGTATATGLPVDINIAPQIPGNTMMVTITKQNYFRYTQPVMITAASGPYLYVMNPVVSDATLNGNGVPEAGETIDMQLNLTNLGVEPATNINATINASDPYLSILNGTSTIAVVDTADTVVAGSFTVQIDPTTPHLHHCTIDLQMTADSAGVPGGYVWNQTLHMTIRKGAKIDLDPVSGLMFENTFLTFTSTEDMIVNNTGPDTLWINNISSDIPQFAPSITSGNVPPGGSLTFQVGFTPDTTVTYTGTITINNTDPVNFVQTFSVEGTGIFAPNITIPDSLYQPMNQTDSVTVPVTILNEGPGPLDFNCQIAGWDPNSLLEGAGGSDAWGHMWIDSDEPSGPTFNWIDITSTGTLVNLTGNNSISDKLNIGFPFTFYGQTYEKLRVCTNGWLSFTTFSVAYNNTALPSNLAPRALVAPLWDDLNFQTDSKVYFENQGNKSIILYENVYRVTGEGPLTFEVVLYNNDNIVLQYLSLNNLVDDYTVGIQNHLANDGLTVAFNESYLHDNLAVLISKHSWVNVAPMSGTIPPNSSMDLTLTFKTNNFPFGDFWASLQVESNDPDEGLVFMPIHMEVTVVGIEDEDVYAVEGFNLYQNTPNPFNPVTRIAYSLDKPGDVELAIYNMLGQKVRSLVNGRQEARLHKVEWDGTNDHGAKVASGIYIYRLKTADRIAVKKMILMK